MPPVNPGRAAVEKAGYRVKWDEPIARGKTGAAFAATDVKREFQVVVKESTINSFEGTVMKAASQRSKYIPDLYLDATRGCRGTS